MEYDYQVFTPFTKVTYNFEEFKYYIMGSQVNRNQWMNYICTRHYTSVNNNVKFLTKMKYPLFLHDDSAPLESHHQDEWVRYDNMKKYGDYYLHLWNMDGNPKINAPQWCNVTAHELEQNATRGSLRKSIDQDDIISEPDAKRARRF